MTVNGFENAAAVAFHQPAVDDYYYRRERERERERGVDRGSEGEVFLPGSGRNSLPKAGADRST